MPKTTDTPGGPVAYHVCRTSPCNHTPWRCPICLGAVEPGAKYCVDCDPEIRDLTAWMRGAVEDATADTALVEAQRDLRDAARRVADRMRAYGGPLSDAAIALVAADNRLTEIEETGR